MPPASRDGDDRRDLSLARSLSWVLAAVSILVLVGWVAGVSWLTVLTPDDNTMKPNTAVCLLLLAVSVLVPRAARTASVLSLALATATLAALPGAVPLDVDQLFVHVDGSSPHPARMAVTTMVCLLLLSVSRLLVVHLPSAAQAGATTAAVIAVVAVLGHTFDAQTLYSTGRDSTMALVTALSLLASAAALLALVPDGRLHWLLHGEDAGAMLLRRMAPVLAVAVPGLGLAELAGRRAGWYDAETGLAIMVTGCLTMVGAATCIVARRLAQHDERLLQAMGTLAVVNHDLESRVHRRAVELEEERGRSAVLRDRNRIAADLHDHVIQTLFAVALQLQAEARRSERPQPLIDASTQVDAAIRGLRSTIFELKRAGTAQQLESDLAEIVSVSGHSDAEVQLRTAGRLGSIPDEIAEHVAAAAREGLSNAVKHARARLITLDVDARGDDLVVVVADDGVGVDPSAATSGMRNLRERAARLGGSCTWTSNETGGATMTWRVPTSLAPGLSSGLVATAADGQPDSLPAALAAVCAAVLEPDPLPRVTQCIRAALHADFANVVVGVDQQHVRVASSCGLPDDTRAVGEVMERRLTVSGHAMSTGQVLRLENTTGAPVPSHLFGSLGIASGLVVPVLGQEGGAALVVGRAEGRFTDADEHDALALASVLPLALEKAATASQPVA